MKALGIACTLALASGYAQASPVSTCAQFMTLEQFHHEKIKVLPETGQLLYASDAGIPQLTRYMAVFGWMQGQIEAGAWSANGQMQQVGLREVNVEGTTYDHITWAFDYCRRFPDARMPAVVNEVFNFFVKR
jgi:hypothetical protein